MFSLIITIISIALVAALALATLYFGGDAFNQGSAKAAAATIVNQASQINGANTLHYLDEQAYDTDLAAGTNSGENLVDMGYLSSLPNPGDAVDATVGAAGYVVADPTNAEITLDGVKTAVCEAINAQAGLSLTLDDSADQSGSVSTQFGCYGDGDSDGFYSFVFK
jgi:hypothetical protein